MSGLTLAAPLRVMKRQTPAQRVDGAARLCVVRDLEGRSRLSELYQRAPARLLFPDAESERGPTAVALNTSGGLTGGDRISLQVRAGAGASVTVVSQAAEKIYRSTGEDCHMTVDLSAAADASVDCLMQETILFEGARLRRSTAVDLAATARLLAVESIVFGRSAMGESFNTGKLRESWRVRKDGRLIWIDAICLDDVLADRRAPFGFGDAAAYATLIYIAPDASTQLLAARSKIAQSQQADDRLSGGATSFSGMLLARLLSPDAAVLRNAVQNLATAIRGRDLPRVWSC